MNNFAWGVLGVFCGVLAELAVNLLFEGRAWPPPPTNSVFWTFIFGALCASMVGNGLSKLIRAWDEFSDGVVYFSTCLGLGFWFTWGIEPYWFTDSPWMLLLVQLSAVATGFTLDRKRS